MSIDLACGVRSCIGIALAALVLAAPVRAEPALIYDAGGKEDKSFNKSAFRGMERWKRETGAPYLEAEVADDAQIEPAIRAMAGRGASPIIGIGFAQAAAIGRVARDFPQLKFAIVDAVVDAPNVQSVVFREHEGSFLVGMLAAMASKTGKVGFIGGMDVPVIRRFQCGYEQGARYANPAVETFADMTGTSSAAWNDPARGGELARGQFAKGVDVVFAAAGGTGLGVFRAARQEGRLAIGSDSNQNHLQPGTILTTMLKRVGVAVHSVARQHAAGVVSLGLAEDGVGYAMDEHNAGLVSAGMKARVEAARAAIVAGRLKVVDYAASGGCA